MAPGFYNGNLGFLLMIFRFVDGNYQFIDDFPCDSMGCSIAVFDYNRVGGTNGPFHPQKATTSINQHQHPTTSQDILPLGFEAIGHSTTGNASPTCHARRWKISATRAEAGIWMSCGRSGEHNRTHGRCDCKYWIQNKTHSTNALKKLNISVLSCTSPESKWICTAWSMATNVLFYMAMVLRISWEFEQSNGSRLGRRSVVESWCCLRLPVDYKNLALATPDLEHP